jgi:hypothetical protein
MKTGEERGGEREREEREENLRKQTHVGGESHHIDDKKIRGAGDLCVGMKIT